MKKELMRWVSAAVALTSIGSVHAANENGSLPPDVQKDQAITAPVSQEYLAGYKELLTAHSRDIQGESASPHLYQDTAPNSEMAAESFPTIVSIGGQLVEVTNGVQTPVVDADGNVLAGNVEFWTKQSSQFTVGTRKNGEQSTTFLYDAKGKKETVLSTNGTWGFTFSPDGEELVMTEIGEDGMRHMVHVDLGASKAKTEIGIGYEPRITPDNNGLIYILPSGKDFVGNLVYRKLDGSSAETVLFPGFAAWSVEVWEENGQMYLSFVENKDKKVITHAGKLTITDGVPRFDEMSKVETLTDGNSVFKDMIVGSLGYDNPTIVMFNPKARSANGEPMVHPVRLKSTGEVLQGTHPYVSADGTTLYYLDAAGNGVLLLTKDLVF